MVQSICGVFCTVITSLSKYPAPLTQIMVQPVRALGWKTNRDTPQDINLECFPVWLSAATK